MTVKRGRTGFTIVELLTTLVIISMLVGMLLPALIMVRNNARRAKQRAQFTSIDMALTAFRNDDGDYPPSNWPDTIPLPARNDYCGSQKLAEALLGWDLLGFHPQSAWRADGLDRNVGPFTYNPPNPGLASLNQRRGPYLELATTNAFRLGNSAAGVRDGLFDDTTPLEPSTFVLCDVFGAKKITLATATGKTVKAGAPILYYRANTSRRTIETVLPPNRIYNAHDNIAIIDVKKRADLADGKDKAHLLGESTGMYQFFYDYIRDPKITAMPWPYRPDSYILISAGVDGEYGTRDDITNF